MHRLFVQTGRMSRKDLVQNEAEITQREIELAGVRKSYVMGPTTTEVLRGVDLEVRRGDLLSIMGPSGCGKSTLMNVMGLLDRPSEGTYRLGGTDTADMTDAQGSQLRGKDYGDHHHP